MSTILKPKTTLETAPPKNHLQVIWWWNLKGRETSYDLCVSHSGVPQEMGVGELAGCNTHPNSCLTLEQFCARAHWPQVASVVASVKSTDVWEGHSVVPMFAGIMRVLLSSSLLTLLMPSKGSINGLCSCCCQY